MKTAHTLFRDFLFIGLLGFVALVVWMLPHLNPPTESETATPPGSMSVSIAWEAGPIDVDLWLLAPGQATATGYSNRGGLVFNLLRDDLGIAGDTTPVNFEHAYSRGHPAGEYIVNVHGFNVPAGGVDVSVEVRKGEFGERQVQLFSKVVHVRHKQELTVVRFALDADGEIVPGSVNRVFQAIRAVGS